MEKCIGRIFVTVVLTSTARLQPTHALLINELIQQSVAGGWLSDTNYVGYYHQTTLREITLVGP
jgi:hypothetical protein